jgi:4-hydroxy-tetrahydrodipicolinate synthase
MQVRGIIPPVVTPMRPDEEVDYAKLRQFVDHQIEAGVHGIFTLHTP